MRGVLVNLHGDDHRARRRVENRLFRADVLAHYERELFPAVIEETLGTHLAAGRAELVSLGHQLMMNLAALNTGVDRRERTREETERLYGQMMKFIEGATAVHSTKDPATLSEEVGLALSAFEAEFLQPSITSRTEAIAAWRAGRLQEDALPCDVLTVLLRAEDLQLERHTLVREIAFFLLSGAHTSATAFTRCIDNMLSWCEQHPEGAARARRDRAFVRRCAQETVRLSPSSPIAMRRALADLTLRSGRVVPAGSTVVIDLVGVNTDPAVFGDDAACFDPLRQLPEGVPPHGLSFGHGMHACIGQELALGALGPDDARLGLVSQAVQSMFLQKVRRDSANPPVRDSGTARPYWAAYPVLLDASGPEERYL